jgi:ribosomal protein S21|tara:strand:+ start:234 stop:464 length:231 start_codon:yes stop_codon:yes gene_type:complete
MSRAVLVEVKPKHRDEPVEKLIKRFVKKCKKERVVENYRDRMYYEKPSIIRKREKERRKRVTQKLQAKIDNSLDNN